MGISRLRRIFHWGPLLALTVITVISTCTIMCDVQWWPLKTIGGIINLLVFLNWNILTLYNFLTAAFNGPGQVPSGWRPDTDEDLHRVQYCSQCECYKAPRSHHCRKCQRSFALLRSMVFFVSFAKVDVPFKFWYSCVLKMDHHCPWINNCVGHFNHASFCYFLFFAPCGCIHALFILIPAMYRAMHRNYYLRNHITNVPIVTLTLAKFFSSMLAISCAVGVSIALAVLLSMQTHYLYYGTGEEAIVSLGIRRFVMCMFAVGLSVGVVAAVGGLLVMQLKGILKNETGIESWICDKAAYRERQEGEEDFVFPYDLGSWENFKQVFHWKPRPQLNGIWYPVRDGCNQFSLTMEQIKQKRNKRERSIVYHVKEDFSGHLLPVTKGVRVCCCPPCTDEPRLRLYQGDRVMVTRWKKHWMYGDLMQTKKELLLSKKRSRGWFPRRCTIEDPDLGDLSPRYFGDLVMMNEENHGTYSEKTFTEKKME